MYTLIANLGCIVDKWTNSFLKFQKKQDKEFLQKVKGQKIYYFADILNKTPKLIAQFNTNGKIIRFPKIWSVPFNQSFSPNHGIYQIDFDTHTSYVGILFKDDLAWIYTSNYIDDLFKINGKHIFLYPYIIKSL